jgi:hypothetical protein
MRVNQEYAHSSAMQLRPELTLSIAFWRLEAERNLEAAMQETCEATRSELLLSAWECLAEADKLTGKKAVMH